MSSTSFGDRHVECGTAKQVTIVILTRKLEQAPHLLDASAAEPVSHALALHINLAGLRAEALAAFSSLTCTERGRAAVVGDRGLHVMAAAMKIESNAAACEWGCSTFANLACGPAEHKRAIASVGAVAAVCGAMQAQRHRASLQQAGCRALTNLA